MQMRAVICDEFGPAEGLRFGSLPMPVPEQGELVIEVACAGLGLADLLIVEGKHITRPDRPFSPGIECAGIVVSKGDNTDGIEIGQRVVGLSGRGALSQFCKLKLGTTFPLPDAVSFEQAVAALVNYGTGLSGLVRRARLAKGEKLLVFGAAGGAGLAVIDIGRLLGAEITAVVSTREKADFTKARGADHAILYTDGDFRQAMKALWPQGADVVYDPVGGELGTLTARLLAPYGRHIIVGFAAGDIPQLQSNHYLIKNASAIGLLWGTFDPISRADMRADVRDVMEWIAQGRLSPPIERIFAFSEAVEAMQSLGLRQKIGKTVVNMKG
jgi:NADPH2:quinone reductase